MSERKLAGYRGERRNVPSSSEYLDAFREAVQARQEHVRHVQELRRSSAASPVTRKPTRAAEKNRALREQD